MSTSYNNCKYSTILPEMDVAYDPFEEVLFDPEEDIPLFDMEFQREEEREEEAFQVILMNEEEMLAFGNALEEYCESKQGGDVL